MQGIFKFGTIKRNYKTTGFAGGDSWQVFGPATVGGIFQNGIGREFLAAKQRHSELSALWQLNQYIKGVNETMRVYIDGITYEIIAPPDGVRELNQMELKLKRVV